MKLLISLLVYASVLVALLLLAHYYHPDLGIAAAAWAIYGYFYLDELFTNHPAK